MAFQLGWRKNLDIRSAIQQRPFILCMNRNPQLTRTRWQVPRIHHHPAAIQLIVTVDAVAIGQVRQHGFSPALYLHDAHTVKTTIPFPQDGQIKTQFQRDFTFNSYGQLISGTTNFWPFRHFSRLFHEVGQELCCHIVHTVDMHLKPLWPTVEYEL